jgi:hypothetical protein
MGLGIDLPGRKPSSVDVAVEGTDLFVAVRDNSTNGDDEVVRYGLGSGRRVTPGVQIELARSGHLELEGKNVDVGPAVELT